MLERSSKDNELKRLRESLVDETTGGDLLCRAAEEGKNPAAVLLGRLGGLKGGKARAAKLSADQRRKIAKMAARTRWEKYKRKQ